ncbi:MAG: alcohol dehydrogenase catalytic domain-containing protein [Planctomycetaceae bacterium]|nr:alcohol dehydrogenase catalytic domain-containing protein [Planctomycetaceae bacterium]
MRALTLRNGRLNLETDAPEPVPGPGEVRIRVLMAGICETDLQLIRGYMNFEGILGHEFVGIALEGRYQGQRVVGEINCPCGACETCRRGLGNHCPHRSVLGILNRHGAFADIVCLPETNLHPVPDDVPDEIAVFTEPVAAAFQIPAQIALDSTLSVIVLGDGRLGALCAQVMRLSGCRTQVVGKHDFKLARLRSLGLDTLRLDEVPGDVRADVVVDCTGSPSGVERALSLVRPRGTIILKTTVADRPPLLMAPFVIDEVTLVGSRCGPFAPALKALRAGTVQVRPLISRSYSLDEWTEAFEIARSPEALKVLLRIE